MKTKIILITIAVFIATACGNKKRQQQAADLPTQMLAEFYTAYITEYSKEPPAYRPEAIAALTKKYLTEELLKKWKDAEFDSITLHLVNRNGTYLIDDIERIVTDAEFQPAQTVDCETPCREILLKSTRQKKDFQLKITFCDEEWKSGFVLYEGQSERISIQFDRSKTEEGGKKGRPKVRNLYYNEIYRREINGIYVLTVQGARVYGADYIRKKDNKKIELEVMDDDATSEENAYVSELNNATLQQV